MMAFLLNKGRVLHHRKCKQNLKMEKLLLENCQNISKAKLPNFKNLDTHFRLHFETP